MTVSQHAFPDSSNAVEMFRREFRDGVMVVIALGRFFHEFI